MTAHLALRLEGSLQSWGNLNVRDERRSAKMPTKSAVIGILAASMGIDHKDDLALKELSELKLTIYSFDKRLDNGTYVKAKRLIDFHTSSGVSTRAGKILNNPTVSRREYLEDALFIAVVSGPVEVVKTASMAVQDPKWGIWLGRKSCLPRTPVYFLFSSSLLEIDTEIRKLGRINSKQEEIENPLISDTEIADQPVSFYSRETTRRFVRYVDPETKPIT